MINWNDERLAPFVRNSPIVAACWERERRVGVDTSTECVVILSQALQDVQNELFKIRVNEPPPKVLVTPPITVICIDCEFCGVGSDIFVRGCLVSE